MRSAYLLLLLTWTSAEMLLMHISILSMADNFERRQAIRRTFLPYLQAIRIPVATDAVGESEFGFFEIHFVCGQSKDDRVNRLVQKEATIKGDVWQLPEPEDYRQLPKRVRAALSLASQTGALFVMKMDDDTFLHPIRFARDLVRMFAMGGWNPDHLYYGRMALNWHKESIFQTIAAVKEHPEENSKLYRAEQFAEGTGYILGAGLFKCLLGLIEKGSLTSLNISTLEDVSMSEWLAEAQELGCGQVLRLDTEHYLNSFRELGRDNYIMMHSVKPQEMDCLHQLIEESGIYEDHAREPMDMNQMHPGSLVLSCQRGEALSHPGMTTIVTDVSLTKEAAAKLSPKI